MVHELIQTWHIVPVEPLVATRRFHRITQGILVAPEARRERTPRERDTAAGAQSARGKGLTISPGEQSNT